MPFAHACSTRFVRNALVPLVTLAAIFAGCGPLPDDVLPHADAATADHRATSTDGARSDALAPGRDASGPAPDAVVPSDASAPPEPGPDASMPPSGGGVPACGHCTSSEQCAGTGSLCLSNRATGEQFCASACTGGGGCAGGYQCVAIGTPSGTVLQCVPSSGSCASTTPPPADAGTPPPPTSDAGSSDDLQHCVDVVNMYRAMVGVAAVTRSSALEAYAAVGAMSDSMTGTPHGHFRSTSGGGIAFAENETPGWPLSGYGSIRNIIDRSFAQMWAEGPGGGHYENMRNAAYHQVGCGIYTTTAGAVWIVQDYQ